MLWLSCHRDFLSLLPITIKCDLLLIARGSVTSLQQHLCHILILRVEPRLGAAEVRESVVSAVLLRPASCFSSGASCSILIIDLLLGDILVFGLQFNRVTCWRHG